MSQLPRLYAIVDTATLGDGAGDAAATLLEAGVQMLQYRHKGEYTRRELEVCRRLAAAARARGAIFVVNDRVDVALMCGAAGVHVGQDDLPPHALRTVSGSALLIGFSTHTADQIRDAEALPVDYIAIGPVFATATKKNPDPLVGMGGVLAARSLTRKPLVAIGGITLDTLGDVLAAGADSVAVARDLLLRPNLAQAARDFLKAAEREP